MVAAGPRPSRSGDLQVAKPSLSPKLETCHSEGIRLGPVLGLRWCLPEMPEESQRKTVLGSLSWNSEGLRLTAKGLRLCVFPGRYPLATNPHRFPLATSTVSH
jgi:hypothetical protein